MKCPRCGDGSELVEVTRHGVVLDTCAGCGGLWLDKGELAKILGQVKQAEVEIDREFQALSSPDYRHSKSPHKRPRSGLERLFEIFD